MAFHKKANYFMASILISQLVAAYIIFLLERLSNTEFSGAGSLVLSQILSFAVPVFLYFLITKQKFSGVIRIKSLDPINCAYVVGMTLLTIPLMYFLSGLASVITPNTVSEQVNDWMTNSGSVYIPMLAVSITPAIFEELAMRGVILGSYKGVDIKRAAIINGLFFAMMHLNLQQFLYTFILGAVFSLYVYYTKSLVSSMLAHFTVNGMQMMILYLVNSAQKSAAGIAETAEIQEAATGAYIMVLIFLLIVAIPCMLIFYYLFKKFINHNKRLNARNAENDDSEADYDYELVIENSDAKLIKVNPIIPKNTPVLTLSFFAPVIVYIVMMILLNII